MFGTLGLFTRFHRPYIGSKSIKKDSIQVAIIWTNFGLLLTESNQEQIDVEFEMQQC